MKLYWTSNDSDEVVFKVVRNWIILVASAILLLIMVISGTYIVEAGEIGIITRFGEVNRVVDSGFGVKIPLIEKKITMDTRIQKEEASSSAVTKDLQDVEANLALNYSIDKETALKLYKDLGVNYKETVVLPVLHESFKAGTAKYSAEELITNRSEAKTQILANVKERLEKYGIQVTDLNIVNLNFSKAFNEAIEQKAVAQQNVEKAKQELERTKIEAERKITEARAEAEAQRLQQSTLTDNMIKKMFVEKWSGQVPQYVGGNGNWLMQIMGQ